MDSINAPKLKVKLDTNFVLWFDSTNRYIIVSQYINDLLEVYFSTLSKSFFLEELQHYNIHRNHAESLYNDLHSLVINSSASVNKKTSPTIIPFIPFFNNSQVYNFSTSTLRVNYGSTEIENLLHPQWSHTVLGKIEKPTSELYIFIEQQKLFLFKNEIYVGHYPLKDYHLLQGQFALQLVNTLYSKTESDWIATFHASTVCNDREAIMIIGASGNGKSTLSAVLMASGIDVLADDFTPLSAENKCVYRFPSGISVKEGAFKMLETLYPDFDNYPLYASTSKNVNIKYIPPLKTLQSGKQHLPCRKIVYVNYNKDAVSCMTPVSTSKILETLIPESWLSPLASNAASFLDWIQDLQCYELTYSDNEHAVSKFNELFKV